MKSLLLKAIYTSMFLLSGIALLFAQEAQYPESIHISPYLQYATPNSIIIKWETKNPTVGKVTYNVDDSLTITKSESSPVKIHEIKLEGLKPATYYQYKVSYDEVELAPASFTTAPVPGTKNWRMVAYGDNRTYPETHRKIVNQILKLNPSMIIHSGDLVSSGDSYEQWKEQYFDPMRGLSENITVFPSLGNHERNSPHYYEYMSVPDENGESYYSFDYGNAHFIALNSNSREAPFAMDSEQTQWLIKDLQEHKDAQWKIVYFHHPLFRCHPSRGIEPQRWVWQEVFEENGVDLVVNGHDHYYQRTYAIGNYQGEPSRGVYHLISGGGGAPNYPIMPKIHAANRRSVHHITVMDFLDDRIIGRAIDGEGNIFDAWIYDKEAENSPEEFISYEIFEIERDLTTAIHKIPPTEFNNKLHIEQAITLENPFSHPLKMTFSWVPNTNWTTSGGKTEILKPGESIQINYSAASEAENMYPLPSAKIQFQTPEGKMAFKNNSVEFHPIKFSAKKEIKPMVLKTVPIIDGDLSDMNWGKKAVFNGFNDVQGGLATQKTQIAVRVNKEKNVLYISGKVNASKEYSAGKFYERDHRYIPRNENIKVHIGVGEDAYAYVLNPQNSFLDTKGRTVSWNSTAKSATKTYEKGWQFELEIPLEELNIEEKKVGINFSRTDAENKLEYEFARTFGKSGLDHRIPMYRSDWNAVERFAELILR